LAWKSLAHQLDRAAPISVLAQLRISLRLPLLPCGLFGVARGSRCRLPPCVLLALVFIL